MLANASTGGAIAYAGEIVIMPDDLGRDLLAAVATHVSAGERTLGDVWRAAQQDYWHANVGSTSSSGDWSLQEPREYLGIMELSGDPSIRIQRGQGPVR
jgi:hypothetical protein